MTVDARVLRVAQFFETLTAESVRRIDEIHAPDAVFKDPFNEVQGAAAIGRIFAHMFERVDAPRFVVPETAVDGDQAFLTWGFSLRRKGTSWEITVRGASHLRFDAAGRIRMHRDYWDAAEELYEKLPLLRAVMRWPKRRAAA